MKETLTLITNVYGLDKDIGRVVLSKRAPKFNHHDRCWITGSGWGVGLSFNFGSPNYTAIRLKEVT